MAELVDALASGASASNGVKVQVLLSAPFQSKNSNLRPIGRFFVCRFMTLDDLSLSMSFRLKIALMRPYLL